jgi:hypothetical protein
VVHVGTVVGIDADVCDRSNLHRKVGMRPADASRLRRKTAVMSRVARSVGTGTKFIGINARVPEPPALDALKTADVIVGCVDTLHPRADLQDFAWRHVIPSCPKTRSAALRSRSGPGPAEAVCALPRWTSTRTFVASLMRPASALAPTAADAKLPGKRVFRHHSCFSHDKFVLDEQAGTVCGLLMNKNTPADLSDPLEVIALVSALSLERGTAITPGFEALVSRPRAGSKTSTS